MGFGRSIQRAQLKRAYANFKKNWAEAKAIQDDRVRTGLDENAKRLGRCPTLPQFQKMMAAAKRRQEEQQLAKSIPVLDPPVLDLDWQEEVATPAATVE